MKHYDLTGKTVVITGAGRGIGAEVARQCADRGAHTVLLDVDGAAATALAHTLPGTHLGLHADVTDSASLLAAVQHAVDQFRGIDVVVANAGIGEAGTVATRDIDALLRTIDINLSGVVRTVHAALPYVIERKGYLLLVSSAAVLKNVPGGSCYAAAKTAIDAFGGALRLEVAHKGVDVGVVHPAWIRTDMFAAQRQLDSFNAAFKQIPWPFNIITSVQDCGTAFVRAIERRQRKAYVPGILRHVDRVRGLFTGWLWDLIVKPRAAQAVPALEQEILTRGAQR